MIIIRDLLSKKLLNVNLARENELVPKKIWDKAIKARKNGTITKEWEELLKNGHWKIKRKH